jgi:hypothetical protein
MTVEVKEPLSVAVSYLWIGFVCAISFMEAWLKFRAPGVTIQIGLGIGRVVFGALNKVEWVFAIALVINNLISREHSFSLQNFYLIVALVLLITQTCWLLSALDARAEAHIQGVPVPSSNLHVYYVIAEILKIVTLFLFSFSLFKLKQ